MKPAAPGPISFMLGVCLLWAMPASPLSGQSVAEKKELLLEPVTVTLESHPGSSGAPLTGRFELPPISAGVSARIPLIIVNQTSRVIDFDQIETSCSCGSFQLREKTIPSRGEVRGELVWNLPPASESGRTSLFTNLRSNGAVVAEIRLSTWMSSSLHLGFCSEGRRIGSGMLEWRLPVALTDPLSLEHLQPQLGSGLDGFTVELEPVSPENKTAGGKESAPKRPDSGPSLQRGWIVIHAHESIVGHEFRFGELVVTETKARKEQRRSLALSSRPPILISPTVLEFRPLDSDPRKLVARVLIQLDQVYFSETAPEAQQHEQEQSESTSHDDDRGSNQATVAPASSVRLTLNDRNVAPEVALLGRSVYRVTVQIPADWCKESDELAGEWQLDVRGRQFSVPVKGRRR